MTDKQELSSKLVQIEIEDKNNGDNYPVNLSETENTGFEYFSTMNRSTSKQEIYVKPNMTTSNLLSKSASSGHQTKVNEPDIALLVTHLIQQYEKKHPMHSNTVTNLKQEKSVAICMKQRQFLDEETERVSRIMMQTLRFANA
jgi:hypothetical protein